MNYPIVYDSKILPNPNINGTGGNTPAYEGIKGGKKHRSVSRRFRKTRKSRKTIRRRKYMR